MRDIITKLHRNLVLFYLKSKRKTSFGPRMGVCPQCILVTQYGFMAEFFKGRFLRTERNFTKKRMTIARINNTFRFYY